MAFFDEIQKLSDGLLAAYDSRSMSVAGIRAQLGQQLHTLHTTRATQSAAQQAQLHTFLDLLRADTSAEIDALHTAREAMGQAQAEQLELDMHTLTHTVESFLQDAGAARSRTAADQHAAHTAWQAFNEEMRRRRADDA